MPFLRAAAAVLALLPALAAAADDAPPCKPAGAGDARLVEVQPSPAAELRREGGVTKVHVINRSGRVLCRVLAAVSLDGRERPGSCYKDDGIKAGAEADILCHFTLLPGESRAGSVDRGQRRPGQPGKAAPPRVKLKVTGVDLADVDAYRAWEARRVVAARKAAEQAEAARAGFKHTVAISRGQGKDAREQIDRALARLKECFIERGKRNPKLTVSFKLRLGVSKPRDAEGEALLAVKVQGPKGLAPEVRECVAALDLMVVPPRTDFEAVADVSYRAEPPAGP